MEYTLSGRTAEFRFGPSISAANVKSLVVEMKPNLENYTDYDQVNLDLSMMEIIDSMGITFLIGVSKTLSANGKLLKVIGVSKEIRRLFLLMKLDHVFTIEVRQGV